ncbi:hypothetical protein M513_13763 [Trichuris suis]|uniref:Major facilitator superfamily (MFS) profile domain-containing protein n=1 Tax=Trichuris suis TaxID=68888 RepID=A0A085LK65_9BILA|nr:hypothetical protein M513_13763 [Trichuris suis]
MTEQKISEISISDAISHSQEITKVELESLYYCGTYQVMVFIAFTAACFAFASNLIFMTYCAWEPPWECYTGGEIVEYSNSTADKCSAFENNQCVNITWSNVLFSSMVFEWNLLCNERKKVYLSITMQMAGHLFGVLLATQISDFYGRRVALLTITAGHAIAGIGTSFCKKWEVFTAFRFVAGFFAIGLVSTSSVYLLESVGQKKRMVLMSLETWDAISPVSGLMVPLTRAQLKRNAVSGTYNWS